MEVEQIHLVGEVRTGRARRACVKAHCVDTCSTVSFAPILQRVSPQGKAFKASYRQACGLCVVMRCGRGARDSFSGGVIYVDKIFRY